jgi:leucine-rich repeat-containing protein 49
LIILSISSTSSTSQIENDQVGGCNVVTLQQTEEGKFVVASRSPLEREKNPDRICLDRRGLTTFPWIVDEPKLRLMSLQHNLISKLEKDQLIHLTKLVFLDLYDNKIEKFCNFDSLENLRVLLMGKKLNICIFKIL